ncbi:hypothetical protein [Halosegnis longus]|uniref:hypothetical protein n=1 Tax=Halosegnis longus TaxID=2216012 RepID=UPI00129EC2D2|nr:hypothetical protein [Halosegnis longus]
MLDEADTWEPPLSAGNEYELTYNEESDDYTLTSILPDGSSDTITLETPSDLLAVQSLLDSQLDNVSFTRAGRIFEAYIDDNTTSPPEYREFFFASTPMPAFRYIEDVIEDELEKPLTSDWSIPDNPDRELPMQFEIQFVDRERSGIVVEHAVYDAETQPSLDQ